MRWAAGVWRQFRRNTAAVAGVVVVLVVGLTAVAAPLLTAHDPVRSGADIMRPPGLSHPFGTDDLGRDIFAGVLFGGRTSLTIGLVAALVSTAIGMVVGAAAGYYGGVVDELLSKVTEIFMVVPKFFLAILLVALLGPSIWTVTFSIAILSWPSTARIGRAEFLALREREFVLASRAIGKANGRIMLKEILPNAMPPILANTSVLVSQAIISESGLSFLGLGDPSAVSYGLLLYNAQSLMHVGAWWTSVFPGLALFLTVLGLNSAADGLNDALDPRRRPAR